MSRNESSCARGPFVYGFIDLFSGSGESWHWGLGMDENRGVISAVRSHTLDGSKLEYRAKEEKLDKSVKQLTNQVIKNGPSLSPVSKLDMPKEESDDTKSISSTDSSSSHLEELARSNAKGEKKVSNICAVFLPLDA